MGRWAHAAISPEAWAHERMRSAALAHGRQPWALHENMGTWVHAVRGPGAWAHAAMSPACAHGHFGACSQWPWRMGAYNHELCMRAWAHWLDDLKA
mmetsp:Transcript_11805/g.34877  ORF Transcript_11805/g.34877 Transcript_11805/m.34877 type:complete len:96 (-) Transcript_11805:490-777(-)